MMGAQESQVKDSENFTILTSNDVDFSFKITLLGDGAVGKTSLRKRYMGEGFKKYYLATIGADFSVKRLTIDGYRVQFQIWDIAGQPRFREVRKAYFTGSDGGLFVHDITRPNTFRTLTDWITEFWKNTKKGPVPIIILSNKMDLKDVANVDFTLIEDYVTQLDQRFQEKYGFPAPWFKTSARTGENVSAAFETLARVLISHKFKRGVLS